MLVTRTDYGGPAATSSLWQRLIKLQLQPDCFLPCRFLMLTRQSDSPQTELSPDHTLMSLMGLADRQ